MNAVAAHSSIRDRLDESTVETAMHPGVVSCSFEASVRDVAALMSRNRVHCIVGFGDVTEDDTRLWGVISDLDLVSFAATEDADAHTAAGLAATEVVTVRASDTLRRAAGLMAEHGVSHLLVLGDHRDRPVGVLSTLDIAGVIGRP